MKTRRLFALFSLTAVLALNGLTESSYASGPVANKKTEPSKSALTGQACPQIAILTGLIQPLICVTKFPKATFDVFIPDPPNSGILSGSIWTLDWGDGNVNVPYVSVADNDVPPLAWRQHTYSSVTDCNYLVSNGISNPCNETRGVQYIAVVHGRDIPADGDGLLQLVDNATGSTTIPVCEGVQTIITIRDNSTWNCQNPTVFGGLPAVPNTDPRNIEWLYGRDPVGAITNTITGSVAIATLGAAPRTSGRISPVPYGPASLSQAITIPATCHAGEYFRVYLKNWNKCNWPDPEYVFTFVNINVIASPPAPTFGSTTFCFGSVPATITATGTGGTIRWYSNASLTTLLYTGATYTHGKTAVGNTTYYVTETLGNGCTGPAATVVLTINPIPNTPTISRSGADFCFDGASSVTLTATYVSPPVITSYQWYKGGVAVVGATGSTIALSTVAQSGAYTVRTFGVAPSNCPSLASAATTVTIYNPATVNAGVDQTICSTSTVSITGTRGGGATTSTWTSSGTGTFGNATLLTTIYTPSATDITNGIVTLTLTTNDPAGPCNAVSDALIVTINPAATVNAGIDQTVCASSPVVTLTGTRGGGATTSAWTSSGSGTFANATALNTTYTPSATDITNGTVTLTLTTNDPPGPCGPASDAMTVTINVAATVNAGVDQTICSTGTATVTGTRGGSASSSTWSTSGTGTFANPSALSTTYTPDATDITNGTVTLTLTTNDPAGPCGPVNDVMILTINPAATVNAGLDQSICSAGTVSLAGTIGGGATNASWSGGTGTYLPNANTLITVYTPSAAERAAHTVTLTLTTNDPPGPCTAVSDNIVISIGTLPTIATLTGNGNVCFGVASTIKSVITGGASPYTINYTRNGVAQPAITPYLSNADYPLGVLPVGTYNYLVTSITDNCGNSVPPGGLPGVYIVIVSANTVANAGPDQQKCGVLVATLAGNSPAPGTGAWTKVSGPGTVTFSNATSPTSTATVSSYGTYVLTWTLTNGTCITSDNVTIDYAETANAGPDQQKCGVLVVTLAANAASAGAGAWAKVSGPGTVTFSDATSATSTATVSAYGTYVLSWTITNGSCNTTDNVTIIYAEAANAGTDQQKCGVLFATMAANAASPGTGAWAKVSGPGTVTFSDATSATSTATVSAYGTYVLSWTITNGSCFTTDNITITYAETANAGPDQQKCGVLVATLAANAASAGAGAWAKVSGPGTVNFSNAASPTSTVTVSAYGTYVLSWTITNGSCFTTDNVTIAYAETANAGPDQQKCGVLVATLAANTPSAGSGAWAKVSGPGTVTFSNTASSTSTATVSAYGTYVLSWTITNGSCFTTDNMTIAYAETANAGADQQNCGVLVAALAANTPSAGAGSWTKFSGPGTVTFSDATSPTSTATVSLYGAYVLRWTITNGSCNTSDDVAISYERAASAGPAQNLCNTLSTTLAGNAPVLGTGTWTFSSGPGTVNFTPTVNTAAATATVSVYGSYVFKWTLNNGGACSTNQDVIINYNPSGQVNQPANQTLCTGTATTAINFSTTNIIGATSYSWTNNTPSIGLAAAGSGNIASFTAVNAGAAPVVATISVTPTLINGSANCVGSAKTFTITVNPTPILVITNPVAVCSPNTININAAAVTAGSTASLTYTYWTDAGATNAYATPTTATAGTYYIKGTTALGCYDIKPVVVNVIPLPNTSAISGGLTNVCKGTNGQFYGVTFNAGNSYNWSVTPATPIVLGGTTADNYIVLDFPNQGTFTLSVQEFTAPPQLCSGPVQTLTITVNPTPAITPIVSTVCSAASFTITPVNGVNGVIPAGTTYSWSAPTGGGFTGGAAGSGVSISGTLTNITNSSQTAIYTVTPTSGSCTGVDFTVIVTINPNPAITGISSSVCSGDLLTVSPVNGVNGIVPAGTNYTWAAPAVTGGLTGGVAGSGTNISMTLINPTNSAQTAIYTVAPVSGSCSGADFTIMVTVNPKPAIGAMTSVVCSEVGFTVTPANIVNGLVPAGTLYTWSAPVVTGGMTGGAAGTGASISGTLTNPTNSTQTATYSITPISGSCSGTNFTVTVTVNPKPAITPMTYNICSSLGFSVTPANVTNGIVPSGTTYFWSAPSGSGFTGGAAGSGAAAISGTLTNITNAQQTAIYTVTPISGSCTGATFTLTVTVDPKPSITVMTTTICSESTFTSTPVNVTNGMVPSGTTYTWLAPTVTGGLTGGAGGSGSSVSGTLANPTNSAQTAIYTVTPISGSCTGSDFTILVTVNPKPSVTPMTSAVCSEVGFTSTPVNITNGTVPSGTSYTWSAPAVTGGLLGGVAGSGATISGTLTNPSNLVQTATYTVTPISGSCTGSDFTVTVTVNPKPSVTPMTSTVCSGAGFAITPVNVTNGVVPPGTTYTWSTPSGSGFTGGAAGSGAASVSGTLTNITNNAQTALYTVTPTSGGCTGATFTLSLTIDPKPTITAMAATICSGSTFNSTPANVTNGVIPTGTTYSWSAPAVSGGLTGGTAGSGTNISGSLINPTNTVQTATYTVTPTSGSCTGNDFNITVTVNPMPTISVMAATICSDGTFTSTPANITNGTVPAGTTYTWAAPSVTGGITGGTAGTNAANITGTLTNPTNALQTATYTVTPRSGSCTGTPFLVNVTVEPKPSITTITSTVCSLAGFTVSPANITNGVVPPGTTYTWAAPVVTGGITGGAAGTNAATISGTLVNPTSSSQTATYTVTPTSGSCTGATFTLTITVYPLPIVYNVTGPVFYCFGASGVTLTLSGSQIGVSYQLYNNAAPDGAGRPGTGSSMTWTNLTSGTYTVKASNLTTLCVNDMNGSLTVAENPDVVINSITTVLPNCFGSSDGVIVINASGGTGTYLYSINNGSTFQSSNTFGGLPQGTYNIVVKDARECSKTAVQVLNQPLALTVTSISVTNIITCFGATNGSAKVVIAGGTPLYSYQWYYDSGLTTPIAGQVSDEATGLAAGRYWVKITDFNGCWTSSNITLFQPAILNASVASANISCFGVAEGAIMITSPTGGSGGYEYSVNGGSLWQASGSFINLSPGTYNVEIRDNAQISCVITLNSSLVITQPPILNGSVASTNVTCFNANNGTISITGATGGFGTYSYSVNGGISWQGTGSFTNLAPGSYDVRIRDAARPTCEIILNPALVITQPTVLSATVTSTNITCFGSTDGTITISSATGGHGTYEYSINGGGSWQINGNYTNLSPGTYNVQIRDAGFTGCYVVLNNALIITPAIMLNAALSSTNITCNGANDGIINITSASGGYGTYEYTINGGANWLPTGSFNALTPGAYDVRIRDAVNTSCSLVLNSTLQITQPVALSATVISTDITCFGSNNGIINIINSAGGYGTYQYSINGGGNWQDSPVFPGLTPATYNVRIRDKAHTGCVVSINPAVIISEPAILNATVNPTNITCFGANDGTIVISAPTGGYGSYGYSINGGTSWQGSGNFSNLSPGTYNIRIRDAINTACIIALNPAVIITQSAPMTAAIVKTNVTCSGAADGTISVNGAAGGYGAYEYTVDGGSSWQISPSFTGLAPGFYNVKIRDAAHPTCVITLNGSLNVTEPPVLNALINRTNVTCFNAGNGTITISSPSGGHGTYEYSADGGATWQSSGSFTNLIPGSYDVQIRDAAQAACIITLNPAVVITQPDILAATVTPTNVTCFGANNGIITITGATGSYGTYEYTINGGTTWSGLGNFTNLPPSTYDVRIRDAAHPACVVILEGALVITQPAILSGTVTKTNITCFGAGDGTITISSPAGGYGTYEYSINGGGSWESSGNFIALGPGNYNVHIRDAAHPSCVVVLNNALQITQPTILNAVVTPTNISCFGSGDGRINITAPTGGYGTYAYSIDGGINWSGSGLFNGLSTGTYDVRISDGANPTCEMVLNSSLTITEPPIMGANVNSSNITCFGSNNGTIIITSPTGGYGTYDYSRDGGTTWQASGNFINLTAGSYNIQIRDRAHTGCVVTLNPALMITEPDILSATVASTNVTCFGANNGTITISSPLGGYATYGYSINGGTTWQSSGNFTNLAPGNYNVRIRDAINTSCSVTLNPALAITQPAILSATLSSSNVTCNSANDGTISITSPLGGYGTYEYTIDGGINWQSSGSFAALSPGFYNVQIRDAVNTGCIAILNFSLRITEPQVLSANVARTNVTCNGANNGTITISSPAGGSGAYQYSINGGGAWQASGIFTTLVPATYDVMIRDAGQAGCITTLNASLVISEPAALNATVTPTNITCFGANDGTISVTNPSGGYGTYQYSVNGGTTWTGNGNFVNLAPATYNVQLRDASNPLCVAILNSALTINQPAVLSGVITKTDISCYSAGDGTITISAVAGGYGSYEFSINGGGSWQTSVGFTGLTPGSYNILIRDAAHISCVVVLNNAFQITQPSPLTATVSKTEITCSGANDGRITISSPAGGYGTYEYSVNGGTTWQPSGNYLNLVPAVYDVRIRDAANTACSVILYPNLIITEPLSVAFTSTGNILLDCFGDVDGIGTFFASGGTLPYIITVTVNTAGATLAAPGFNSQTFFGAGAGVITANVTDSKGCSSVATITITQPALLMPGSIGAGQVLCSGINPATITESTAATGGPAPYVYQWQYSTNQAGPFVNIAGATNYQYTPASGAGSTLYYRRMVTSGFCTPVYSNVIEVLVNPLPIALLSGGETICPGQTSILKVTLPAGTGPFTIDIENYPGVTITGYTSGTDIIVTPAATTVYRILRVRDFNGCEVLSPSPYITGTATVNVNLAPSIATFLPSPAVCEFTFATYRVTANGTNLNYQWYVNEGSGFIPVADGGTYFGATSPTLQILNSLRTMNGYLYHAVVSGCGLDVTSADGLFTVNTAPELILHPSDSTICAGSNAAMEADATGSSITWQWYVNKGAGFVPVDNDSNFDGATTRTLTITNATMTFNNWIFRARATGICGVPVFTNFARLSVLNSAIITLNPVPKAICENGMTSFLANGYGYFALQWQVFAGGIWTNITDDDIYYGTGTNQLSILNAPATMNGNQYRLGLSGTCSTTYSNPAVLTVNSNPVVFFPDPIFACGGIPTVINGNPTGGSGTYTLHRWTGDIGPLNSYSVQTPTFNSQIPGDYYLNYKVTDSKGCTGNDSLVVKVDSPSALYTKDINNGCTPLSVAFTKDMTDIAKFWWNFNDGSPVDSVNANPVHIFTNASATTIGYYNVTLTVRSAGGCINSFTSMVTVYPLISATFTANKDIVCSGSAIVFTSAPGASKYFWEFGDGVSSYSTNVTTHPYINLTTDPVVLEVRLTTTSFYNCIDVNTYSITVMPVPVAQFEAIPPTQIFNSSGNPVAFTNTTNAGSWNWLWRFGDGATSLLRDPVHSYTAMADFNVTLKVSNANCSDSVKHIVSVMPPAPVANFDSIPPGCEPLEFSINNTSLNTDLPGTSYRWDFDDGSISTAKNPTYTYFTSGIYRVELTVTGPGGTSIKSQIVRISPSPKAYFEVSPTLVFVNDEKVRCFNLSEDADYYLWEFGDGDTSKVQEPFHKYMESGVFDITLWAYSNNGCMDKYVLSPGVTVEPPGDIRFSTVFTPNKEGPIELTSLPEGGIEIDQFFFPPIREKVIEYKLQIFNRLGLLIFESHDINTPWNGWYKGKLCPQGVYVWYLEGKYANGQPFKKVGDITLLH